MSESHDPQIVGPDTKPSSEASIAAAQQTDAPLSPTGDDLQAPKVKIGTQRPGAPRVKTLTDKVMSAEARPSGVKTPVPSIRGNLPDDLEAEIAAALQGASLNDMVDTGGKSTKLVEFEQDSRRPGRIIKIYQGDVFVELGPNAQGVLPLTNFTEDAKVGQIVDVIVGKFNEDENFYGLSLPNRPTIVGDWSQVSEGAVIDVRITGHNKGGLEAEVGNLRGFIPAGQVSTYRIENFEEFVGQSMTCLVTEVNVERRRLVLSRRAVLEREKAAAKEQMLKELEVGQIREGTVRSLMDFGAFVDLGGVDGLLHISRLAWTRVKHPSEVLTVGQGVKVKVTSIDAETGKIGLSLRDLGGDPWVQVPHKYKQGDVIRGPVVRILDRVGAFVQLEPGVDGLVHISEIDYKRVFRIQDFVKEGQTVEAKIMSIDMEQKRVGLSMKAIMARPEPVSKASPEVEEAEAEPETPPPPLPSFPEKPQGRRPKKSKVHARAAQAVQST